MYTLGINAANSAAACETAARAAENAIDRDGDYVGGVVVELHTRCVGSEEFQRYEDFLIQPIDQTGIFYVSGISYFSASINKLSGAERELDLRRQRFKSNGPPSPSFVHPPLKVVAPEKARLVCPVCKYWVEIDSSGLLYSLFCGLDPFSSEYEEGRLAGNIAAPFVQRHFECLSTSTEFSALIFIYESDERFLELDEMMRE